MKQKLTHALIVIGGDVPDTRALAHLDPQSVVICADSGLDHALTLGLTPQVFIGDMDSVSPAALERSRHETWEVITHQPLKDHTDTELALRYAVDQGFDTISVLWGSGDRIDHVLGVLAALAHPTLRHTAVLRAWIGHDRLTVLHGPRSVTLQQNLHSTISLMPLGGDVTAVTTTGLQWNLDHEQLSSDAARGVSNISIASAVTVSIESGVLAVINPGFTLATSTHAPTNSQSKENHEH